MSDIKLFDDGTENNRENDATLIERRADGQWIFAVGWREGMTIAFRKSISYAQAFAAADKCAPEILGRQELLFGHDESSAARLYRENAASLTAKLQRETGSTEKRIRPIEVIDQDIRELEDLLSSGNGYNRMQRAKLDELRNTHREFEEQEIIRRDEPETLLHDWDRGIDLPTFLPQQANNYHDFALPRERVMRIRFTHTTKAENIAGVDLIYEFHRPKEKKARLAVVQYKLPQNTSKNVIINDKIQEQLDKMRDVFCENELCAGPSYHDKPVNNRPYQLPHCCAFFRPTERLQSLNSRLATTGYHIRICDIDRVCDYTKTPGRNKVITPDISRQHGISYTIFEELFNTERLGSRWLSYDQLQKFHQAFDIIRPSEQAGIYIQEAPEPEPATLFSR